MTNVNKFVSIELINEIDNLRKGKNMKDIISEILMMVLIVCFIVCFLCIPMDIYASFEKANSNETEMYVAVVDKNTITELAGRTPIVRYFIQVEINGKKTEYLTQVTRNQYSQINIGDKVLCTVFSNNDKIIDVKYIKNVKNLVLTSIELEQLEKKKIHWQGYIQI